MRRLTFIVAGALLGAAACGDSTGTGSGSAGSSGGGASGSAGTAGTSGSAGSAGAGGGDAGTSGSAGTTGGSAGTTGAGGSAGSAGSAGTIGGAGASGTGGTTGAAGRGGGGGSAGSAGTTAGAGGRGGTGGAAGNAGNAGTTGRGGAGGTAGGAAGSGGTGGALSPAPGQYGRRAMLPASNSELAVGEVNGKIYLVGGYPSSPSATVATVLVYTIATDTWATGPNHPIPVHHPVVTGVNGRLYSLGGQTSGADTNRVFELDPTAGTNGTWRELMAMPTARGAGASAVVGDKIYVVAGRPPAGNAFEVYDISDNAWMALPDLPGVADRNHLAATTLGGKIYVAGGRYDGGGFGSPRTDSLDIFDPATGMWTTGARMLRPRGGVNGVAANGCFFVWGGEGQGINEPNDVFPDHDVYNPRTNTWTALLPLPTPIHGVTGAAFVGGLIFIPGGGIASGGSSGSNIFQVYRPNMTCE